MKIKTPKIEREKNASGSILLTVDQSVSTNIEKQFLQIIKNTSAEKAA